MKVDVRNAPIPILVELELSPEEAKAVRMTLEITLASMVIPAKGDKVIRELVRMLGSVC